MTGGEVPSINVANPKASSFPSWKLTTLGGEFPHWNADGSEVHWALGNAYFSYNFAGAKQAEKELAEKKKKEKEAKKEKGEKEDEEEKDEEAKKDEKKRRACLPRT